MDIRVLNQTQFFKRYGIAIAAVATALALMLAVDPMLELTKSSYVLFFGAVTVSALYGGRNPGIVATFLSAICANYFFIQPQFTWTLNLADGLRMTLFILQGLLISDLVGALSTAQAQLQKNFAQLKATQAEVQTLNQDLHRRVTELNQAKEKYHQLFTSIDEGFCVVEVLFDTDGHPVDHRILQANPAFERHSGITQPEGKNASELAPGLELFWNDLYANVLQTGKSIRMEQRSSTCDRWFDVRVSRVGDGTLNQVAIVFTDISDRKNLEQALQTSQNQLRSILNTAPVSIAQCRFFANRTYTVDYHSVGCKALTGYEPAEITAELWAARIVPEDWEAIYDLVYEAVFQQEPITIEYRFRHKDGTLRWIADYIASRRDDAQDCWIVTMAGIDITDRKQSEAILLASHATFRQLVEHSPFGIYVVDADFRLTQVGRGAQKVFENVRPLIGRDFAEVLRVIWAEPFASEVIARFRHTLETGEPYHAPNTIEYRHDIGEIESYDWKIERITLPNGRFGVVCHFYDLSERQRYEAALRESEERFRTLTATIPQLVWTTTPAGQVDYLSEQWAAYIGLPLEQLYGWGWLSIVHPDDVPNTTQKWEHGLQVGEPVRVQHRFRFHTGEWHWNVAHGVPIKDSNGQVIKWVGTCTDIQSEMDAKAALEQSEEQIRNILESVTDGFFALDETWCFTYVNQAAERILDRIPHDLLGKCVWTEYPGLQGTEFERIFWEAMRDRKDGFVTAFYPDHHRWYAVHAYPANSGITIYFRDVTAQIQAETALRESEERYRHLIESVPQLVWTADTEGHNCYVSQQMCEYIGLSADQLMNLDWQTVIHPDDAEWVLRRWLESVQTGMPYEAEYRLRRADGQYRWQLVRATPFRDEHRQIVQWFGVSTDIHEKQELEQQRSQLLQQAQAAQAAAERANRVKDEFLAILSHELRSPLTPILAWAQLLQTKQFDAGKTRQALATIERSAKVQTQLIDDLLDVARILRGKLNMTMAPVDLTSVIEAAIDTVRTEAVTKNIQLTVVPAQVQPVSGDASRLQQVIWNLLSNAIKFTPDHGRIEIRLECVDQQAQITVSDTGKGIKPDFLPYIFESFQQEDVSVTRQFGGLGLGLSIVKHLVEAHGGTVNANSPGEGQGSSFTVKLPLLKEQPLLPSSVPSAPTPVNLAGIKVLAVDDNEDVRELLSTLLLAYGAEVKVVASGEEVLLLLNEFKPDVLVCDICMPDMDGYTVLQHIRALPSDQRGNIPAIALTAYAREEDYQRSLHHGFQQHLAKPLEPEQLAIAIAQFGLK